MKRRRLIAIISLCTLATIAVMVVVAGAVVMRTDGARNFVQGLLQSKINGHVYVGRLSGNPFAGITVDTFAIRDTSGALVVSTGRLEVKYDIRDLLDNRIHLRHVVVDHPLVHLRDFGKGEWNYQMSKSSGAGGGPKAPGGLGSFVVLDSVRATDATFLLSLPWNPDDTLRGAARESVIARELARTDRLIRRSPRNESGFSQTYAWTQAQALITHARLADPDSNHLGQQFEIARIDATEFVPPFQFRNVRGVVRRLGDTAWLDVPHFDLPASTGSAKGKLVWGSDLPIRYDIVVRGDSVALNDINWVYNTLPKTGGGSMVLRISNRRNLRVMDYHIDSMDVRSTRSHLVGEMTFGVGGGGPLQIRNVNLRADPVDFELIKTLNGKPFPIDWRGQIFGDVHAPGGPVNEFDVTSFRGEWRDSGVPGAVSRMAGAGGLNIQSPALTEFLGFNIDVQTLDLRSIQRLFPAFPRLNGTIAGQATLDSIWTDVRFSDADITHRDGPGAPSRFTGSGRITDGSPFITYDVNLVADPLSFDMMARSFPGLTLRGLAYGPMSIKGQSPDLQIVTNLISAAGSLRFAGNIDIDSLGGYGARGVGELRNVNLARLGMRPNAATTSLSGRYTVDVRGSSPSSLTGTAEVRFDSSTYDRIRLDTLSRATLRFDQGRLFTIDTVVFSSPIGRLTATGALGLPGGATDSIALTLTVDSLGGLRPYFTADGRPADVDTLLGRITVNGRATGRLDSLFVSGRAEGENLNIRGIRIDTLVAPFSFADVLRNPSGVLNARLAGATLGGVEFDTAAAAIQLVDSSRAKFSLDARALRGDSAAMRTGGEWSKRFGTTSVRADSFSFSFGTSLWTLERPVTLTTDSTTLRLDSLSLRSGRGGYISLAGIAPTNGPIDFRLNASAVPLRDIDRVTGQVNAPVSGFADLTARVGGTREAPVIDARATVDSIMISQVSIGRLFGAARYANDRGSVSAEIFQGPKRVLQASADSLPLAIRWLSFDTLPGQVRARAVADSADFTLIQAWVDLATNVTGKVSGALSLDGSWRKPNMAADATLTDGGMRIDTLGIALSKMFGRVEYRNDTLTIDSVRAVSGGDANSARVDGKIAFAEWRPSWFDLSMRMNDFLAYDRPELARIYARTDSGPVRLRGTFADDSLTGVVQVDRGSIFLPDPKLVGKRFSTLDTLTFRTGRSDTTLYQRITENLKTNLRAHIGGAFNLSSDYANIPLSGSLQIVPASATDLAHQTRDYISRLAPLGTINANGGWYELQFPPVFSKRFDVQRGGTITFDRDAQWNGILNISARYVVRAKPGVRPEVPIVVDVTDRLLTPRVVPRSEASFFISQSDLISYIAVDEPGFFDAFSQTSPTVGSQTLLNSLFTPIAISYGAEQLRTRLFNSWVDQLRVEQVNYDAQTGGFADRPLRLTTGKEFFDGRVFLSGSTGFCGFGEAAKQNTQSVRSLSEQWGVNADIRLRSTLTNGSNFQFSSEPSTSALLCSPGYSTSLGVAPTPRQYSLSLLMFWRW